MANKTRVKEFRKYLPEIQVSDEKIEIALDEASRIHNVDPLATIYCAAHLIAYKKEMEGEPEMDGGSGIVSTESLGPRSVSFINESSMQGGNRKVFFESSPYGRMFLQLEYRCAPVRLGFFIGNL